MCQEVKSVRRWCVKETIIFRDWHIRSDVQTGSGPTEFLTTFGDAVFYARPSSFVQEVNTLAKKRFKLSARISSANPSAVKPVLERFIGSEGTVTPVEEGFEVNAELEGESAKDLNRMLLSEMRRVEKRTRIRAEWTLDDTIERFFDYVPKGTRKAQK